MVLIPIIGSWIWSGAPRIAVLWTRAMQASLKSISPASFFKLVTRGGGESDERVCRGAHGEWWNAGGR
jgi:hypothetical protein